MLLPNMRFTHITFALLFCALAVNFRASESQLSQDTFNIAQGKKITASATCGYDLPPGQNQELFCKLATVPGKFGIDGLECGECNPKVTSKDHRIQYAIDGTERWWQSPPLSRGLQYNEINITVDLGQVSDLFLLSTLYSYKRNALRVQYIHIYLVSAIHCKFSYLLYIYIYIYIPDGAHIATVL